MKDDAIPPLADGTRNHSGVLTNPLRPDRPGK
jgi:hypothetical protein